MLPAAIAGKHLNERKCLSDGLSDGLMVGNAKVLFVKIVRNKLMYFIKLFIAYYSAFHKSILMTIRRCKLQRKMKRSE